MYLNESVDRGLKKESTDISILIRQCVSMLEFQAKEKNQKIHQNISSIEIIINYEKIWRVVSNLLSNAIKFTPLFGNIYISLVECEDTVELSVKDEGIGIPLEVGDSIFDLSNNLRRKGTAGEESFGLGLYITKQIVEAHNATIRFVSIPNQGTTFYICFSKESTEGGPEPANVARL